MRQLGREGRYPESLPEIESISVNLTVLPQRERELEI